jgi:hypothetical protein
MERVHYVGRAINSLATVRIHLMLYACFQKKKKGRHTIPPMTPILSLIQLWFISESYHKCKSKSMVKNFLPIHYFQL